MSTTETSGYKTSGHETGQQDLAQSLLRVDPLGPQELQSSSRRTPPFVFLTRSAATLFRARHDIESHRTTYAEVKHLPAREPMNREADTVDGIMHLIQEKAVRRPDKVDTHPYWNPNIQYNAMEVCGTLIQYLDYHKSKVPSTVLPPEEDIARYINTIFAIDGPVTVTEQLRELLTITNNNLVGAINLGFIASRFIGRGLDTKAYPNLHVDDALMLEWGKKVAQFDTDDGDSTGDTYYFWTHVFAGLFFNLHKRNRALYQTTFQNGTSMMTFVRRWITRLPTTSDHYMPSLLGRQIGLALSEPDWYSATS